MSRLPRSVSSEKVMVEVSRKASVLLLLGSGASSKYLPSTTELTTTLVKWNAIFGSFKKTFPAVEHGEVRLTFEDYIDIIDLITLGQYSREDPAFYPSAHVLGMDFQQVPDGLPSTGWQLQLLAHRSRQHILDTIYEAHRNRGHLYHAPVNQLLRHLSANYRVILATLNYDSLTDDSGLTFYHGFDVPWLDGKVFNPLFEQKGILDHIYMPLHGSIHFAMSSQTSVAHDREPLWLDDLSEAHALRSVARTRGPDGKDWLIDPLMITGRNKVAHTILTPYSIYMSRLRTEAMAARTWIVIGYSGRDAHINALLRQIMLNRIEAGKAPQLVLCDKISDIMELHRLLNRIFESISVDEYRDEQEWVHLSDFAGRQPIGRAWIGGIDALPWADVAF